MTDMQKLLKEKGILKAVVIDDAFDEVPQPDELNEENWSIFLDDLTEAGRLQIETFYPEFESTDENTLRKSQGFIDVLWKYRKQPYIEVATTALFEDYENRNEQEKGRLENLVQILENMGLACTKVGREFRGAANDADLIVIDLFLGPLSHDDSIERAVKRVRELVSSRDQSPPLVILTSSSSRLDEKRNDFRDKAGLLSSTFRVENKSNLMKDGRLELILSRLADHYEDAKRVAGFLYAWDKGLEHIRKDFLQMLRRLDLSDLAQIRTLLLDAEGERLGDYLLDVADRVLQHEIEGNRETVEAALELNKFDSSKYPAPHLTGTPDLQDLVHRMVFMHNNRLELSKENDILHLRFGDVLWYKKKEKDVCGNEVRLVVTPSCDLVRNETEPIMLLAGQLQELKPEEWSYRDNPVRTSIIIRPDGERKWIKWKLREVETLRQNELNKLIQDGHLSRIGRLREVYSLAIQQKLLAHMGRIGQPANLPAPFPVTVSLFCVDNNHKASKLGLNDVESATCYVGRRKDTKPVFHLVLTEQTCDGIERALQDISEEKVSQGARASLKSVKKDHEFIKKFEQGRVEVPQGRKQKKYIEGANKEVHAVIMQDDSLREGTPLKGKDKNAAVIVKVTDISNQGDNQTDMFNSI